MGEPDDRKARMVFDLGLISGKVYFDDISLKPIDQNSSVKKNGFRTQEPKIVFKRSSNGNFMMFISHKVEGSVELINIAGKSAVRLKNTVYIPGSYTIKFPVNKISSGTYFIRLVDSGINFTSSPFSIIK
jgi:hypothetical protein